MDFHPRFVQEGRQISSLTTLAVLPPLEPFAPEDVVVVPPDVASDSDGIVREFAEWLRESELANDRTSLTGEVRCASSNHAFCPGHVGRAPESVGQMAMTRGTWQSRLSASGQPPSDVERLGCRENIVNAGCCRTAKFPPSFKVVNDCPR
jgi:hypothetical protein